MNFNFQNNNNNNIDPFDRDQIVEKIDMDELYNKKFEIEEHRRKIYGKILNRAHSKIKVTSRLKIKEQFCFYVVPEFMIGVPKYNLADCTNYVIDKLVENGFFVKFTEPNLLFISWQHFIPFYQRSEIKKTHGVSVDGFGNIIGKNKAGMVGNIRSVNQQNHYQPQLGYTVIPGTKQQQPNFNFHTQGQVPMQTINYSNMGQTNQAPKNIKIAADTKMYKNIDEYKAKGIIYDKELMENLKRKI